MIACYIKANDITLARLNSASALQVVREIEAILDSEIVPYLDIDKMWDAIHFLLTGVSATEPILDNLFSEAVIGEDTFREDVEEDFIGFSTAERVHEISEALSKLNLEELRTKFSASSFKKHKIYPEIWSDGNEVALEELFSSLEAMISFYKDASRNENSVLVTIY